MSLRTPVRFAWCMLVLAILYSIVEFLGGGLFFEKVRTFDWKISKSQPREDFEPLFLTEAQCRDTFPLLTKEIDGVVAKGPFQFNRSVDDYQGQVQGRIKDGKLLILSVDDRSSKEMLDDRNAVLHQLHRAILTSPTPLPSIFFTISILDSPRTSVWSFSRFNLPSELGTYWTIPHFSFWSWPKSFIGTLDQALSKINQVEEETPWGKKIDRVVWRGTVWFNSIANLNLRPSLIEATKGMEWADVEDLKWVKSGADASNAISIEEFCRYKYIIYTEGVSYSGRLPFHQACQSIILTPPPNYLLHTTHLMRPLFSSSLPFSKSKSIPDATWPRSYSPLEANIVFVDPEWEDLEHTVEYLRENAEIAEGIARRQRGMFVDAGYLSPAAEACYWRALIRGWSSVAVADEEKWLKNGKEGMRWETFVLAGKTSWD